MHQNSLDIYLDFKSASEQYNVALSDSDKMLLEYSFNAAVRFFYDTANSESIKGEYLYQVNGWIKDLAIRIIKYIKRPPMKGGRFIHRRFLSGSFTDV